MRNCQPGAYYAGAGRWVAEAELRHISVSDHPTTDIRETCTYQTCAKVPKRSEILGSLSPGSGTLMDLGPCTSFLSWDSGNPGPQNCDIPQDPGNPGPQNFDSSKTLGIQDLKIWIYGETLETQNLKILMSRDFKVIGPYTIQYRIAF